MEVLNSAFSDTDLSYVLAGTTRTINSDWFHNAGPDNSQQTAMKEALRHGGKEVLNIYTVGSVCFQLTLLICCTDLCSALDLPPATRLDY